MPVAVDALGDRLEPHGSPLRARIHDEDGKVIERKHVTIWRPADIEGATYVGTQDGEMVYRKKSQSGTKEGGK